MSRSIVTSFVYLRCRNGISIIILTIQQTYQIFLNRQKLLCGLSAGLLILIITNIFLDYLSTVFQNSSFYLSESLLFSSYWILYFPLLLLFSKLVKRTEKLKMKLIVPLLSTIIHLFIYPAMIWILSRMFYDHTFPYGQTFNFALSAYFIKTSIIYGVSFIAFIFLNKKVDTVHTCEKVENEIGKKNPINSILITESNSKKLLLQVNDIFYFSANSPYINIYHLSRKYLYTETLKSLEAQLDTNRFVRVHKSHIVNLHKISSIQSRQNGDYDITLSDGTILRVSRSYAKNFKLKFSEYTRLDIK